MTGGRADDARVRTAFLGSGGFGRQALRRLAGRADVDLVGVVTAPARPAGRSQQLTATPIAETASELGIGTILTPDRLRAPDAIEAVLALHPDLLVLADYGQIVPAALLGVRLGALNLHPSLLPRHRGSTPIPAAILAGDRETGVSLMRMDEGLDTGPIIDQERLTLDATETTPALEAALEHVAAGLLDRNLGRWIRGHRTRRPPRSLARCGARMVASTHGGPPSTWSARFARTNPGLGPSSARPSAGSWPGRPAWTTPPVRTAPARRHAAPSMSRASGWATASASDSSRSSRPAASA